MVYLAYLLTHSSAVQSLENDQHTLVRERWARKRRRRKTQQYGTLPEGIVKNEIFCIQRRTCTLTSSSLSQLNTYQLFAKNYNNTNNPLQSLTQS